MDRPGFCHPLSPRLSCGTFIITFPVQPRCYIDKNSNQVFQTVLISNLLSLYDIHLILFSGNSKSKSHGRERGMKFAAESRLLITCPGLGEQDSSMHYQNVCSIHIQIQAHRCIPEFEESFLWLTLMSLPMVSATDPRFRKHADCSWFWCAGPMAVCFLTPGEVTSRRWFKFSSAWFARLWSVCSAFVYLREEQAFGGTL